ncbi:hypothetical protein HMPREF0290_0896 [Corynebacterium efficiens YS-314]|uniref:hypothetical protein n=1 Tax=Corynebacterium efficiens TaxID=152794 RepID=UPI0001B86E83|nr:hypothetical protein [Corynebacterium efficiens]EEW50448.1 hypothetical protein HMPREF0290_0896 [Corynebacterium efficiens YS-314]
MTNSHDRVELLEEVVDASTLLLSFFAAERIEMKSTIGIPRYPLIDDDPSTVELSLTEQFLSEGLKVSEERLRQSEAKCEAAERNVATLQKAVKDHAKQEQVAEEKIAWLEKELERLRQEGASTNLDLIKMQTNEIDNLRKDLADAKKDSKTQATSSSSRVEELEAALKLSRDLQAEATTDLEQTRAALVTARREADESAQKVEELTRQLSSYQSDFVERDNQLSAMEGRLFREVEQLQDKQRKIHVHLTRALRKFEDDPNMTIRAIDSALKLAGKAS